MKNRIKVALSVLLLICLFDMPYGYYQLIRFGAFVVFAYLAYGAIKCKKEEIALLYGAMAILFQPFIKIALGRTVWNVVDIAVAVLLIVSVIIANRERQ